MHGHWCLLRADDTNIFCFFGGDFYHVTGFEGWIILGIFSPGDLRARWTWKILVILEFQRNYLAL